MILAAWALQVETQLHTISQAFGAGAAGTPMVGSVSSARGAELVTHEVVTNAENTGGIPNIATFNMPERYVGATAIGPWGRICGRPPRPPFSVLGWACPNDRTGRWRARAAGRPGGCGACVE